MASIAVDPADPLAIHKLVYLNKTHTLKMFLAPYKSITTTHHHHPATNPTTTATTNGNGATLEATAQSGQKEKETADHYHPHINSLDLHLHAPLHLAVMLQRKEMVQILLKAGANPLVRSGSGWTPRQEATSLGDREMIELITRYQRKEFSGSFKTKAMNLVKQLSADLDQFYFQLQWEFQSWVPFVSGLCPKDTYHIWKKGNAVRMDTSLVGFENMKWIRGHISIVFRVDPDHGPELVIIDRVKKITQVLARSSDDDDEEEHEPTDEEIQDEVSICFNSNITSTNVPTSAIKFQRAKAGMWGYRSNKVEKVGEFECAVWKMDGVEFRTRVRTEHLKDEHGKPIVPAKSGRGGRGGHHHHHHALGRGGHQGGHAITAGHAAALEEKDEKAKRHGRGMQPRKPIHRPLFAPFSDPDSELSSSPEQGSQMEKLGDSEGALSVENADGHATSRSLTPVGDEKAVVPVQPPKKHMRSTGTISDDAFFETALEEAESETAEEMDEKLVFRPSLPSPPPASVTFEQYFDATVTTVGDMHLGRPLEQKESKRTFGATLWMYENQHPALATAAGKSTPSLLSSTDETYHGNESVTSVVSSGSGVGTTTAAPSFPLTIEKILPLLEVIGMDNNRLVGKLKEFLEYKLPPGFPIRANIPVYPSLSADVTFVNYDAHKVIEDEMFEVPGEEQGYSEGFVIRPGGEDDS
ncbi:Ankyrin repeat domain-containing protein 13C [Mortierella hygrophila]|uniref:Ankyrin repeat domain-containing protein 13C n=1 Tax=Mortierella hygrophila TaxID=979708 RepID=A0A9P6JZH5_9FUNG|nr:Ankyrin repeat domain-containing protein 13C [Mortierella hygrophila]